MADPKIRYDILANAEGQEDVARLARELEKLDGAFDPQTAARAAALAQEIEKLGAQRAALDLFERALVDANEAGKRLQQSSDALQKLEQRLQSVEEPTRKQAGELQKLGDAATAAATDLTKKTEALNGSRVALERLGLSSDSVAQSEATLAAGLQRTTAEVQQFAREAQQLAAAQVAAAKAAQDNEQQLRELVASLRAAETAATEYAAATARAATASADDSQATQARSRAATALLDAERALSAEQRALASQRNAGRAALVAEAQAYAQSAAAAREAQAAIAQTAIASRQAAAEIERSFGVLGVRSISAIEAEIRETELALSRLETRARAGAVGLDEIQRAAGAAELKMSRLRAEIAQVQAAPSQFEALSASINGIVTRFAGLGAAIATVGFSVKPVIDATLALEAMRRTLTTVTGSAEQAEVQIEAVRDIASRSGQQFDKVAESYSKFAASALQSGLSLEQVQSVFASVSTAAGNLGLDSEKAKRALEALSQIASKGTVSMEELRQQLGDALPGVLPLLAKELGLTQRELVKVVESGQLLAQEAIPAIGRALEQLGPQSGAQVDGMAASWNRLVGVVKEAGVAIVEGPIGTAAGAVLQGLAQSIGVLATVAVSANQAMKVLGITVLATLDAVRGNRTWEEAGRAISDFAAQSGARIQAYQDRVDALGGSNTAAAQSAQALATSTAQASTAALNNAAATDQQAKSVAQVAVANVAATEAAENQSRVLKKLIEAREAEGKALQQSVALSGNEKALKEAAATAATAVADASVRYAESLQREVAALQTAREATLAVIKAQNLGEDAARRVREEHEKLIESRQADAEKAAQQAAAATAAADAARLSARSYGDQSQAIDGLRKSVEDAQAKLTTLAGAFREDKSRTEELAKASRDLAEAKNLLNDALDDQEKATKRATEAIKASLEVTKAEIELQIAKLRIERDGLLQQGRETEARKLDLQIRELQLTLTRAGTDAKLKEAKAIQDLVVQQYLNAEATNTLTPALRQELNTRYEQQRAIVLQTEAARLNEAQEQKGIEASRTGTTVRKEHGNAVGGETGAIESNSAAKRRNTQDTRDNARAVSELTAEQQRYQAALELERRRAGITGGGPTDSTVGLGAAGIRSTPDGDVFTAAGRQARNDSFKDTPFVSGSGSAARVVIVPAREPPRSLSPAQAAAEDAAFRSLLNRGIDPVTGRPFPGGGAAAVPGSFTVPGTGRELVSTDTDTPGTVGTISRVPLLGKYEIELKANGRTTTAFADTPDQAQAFIDNLQDAFRAANGG